MSVKHHLSYDECIEEKQERSLDNDKKANMALEEQMLPQLVHNNKDENIGNTSQETIVNETTNLVTQPEGTILDLPYCKRKRKVDETVVQMRKQMREGGFKYKLRPQTWKARQEAIDNLVHGKPVKKRKKDREKERLFSRCFLSFARNRSGVCWQQWHIHHQCLPVCDLQGNFT